MTTKELSIEQRKWIGDHPGFSITRIQNYFKKYHSRKVSRVVISRWRVEGSKERPIYADKARSGRPRVTNVAIRKEAKRLAKQGDTARDITTKLRERKGVQVSVSTTRRTLIGGRKPLTWAPVKPQRKLSEINKQWRVDFCNSHPRAFTSHWIFIDAKYLYVYLYPKGRLRYAWKNVGDRPPSKLGAKPGAPWVFLFYGAVGRDYKSPLYFVAPSPPAGSTAKRSKENFKSKDFIEMLDKMYQHICKAHPKGRFRMLWDHAKQHTSNMTKVALQDIQHNILQDYPPQSWDINVIENCWAMLDHQLNRSRAKSTAKWYHRIRAAWEKVDQASINKLVDGVRDRLHIIVESKGDWVTHH